MLTSDLFDESKRRKKSKKVKSKKRGIWGFGWPGYGLVGGEGSSTDAASGDGGGGGESIVRELSYKGNIGAMEFVEFWKKASQTQKTEMKSALAQKDKKKVLELLKEVTGTELMTEEEDLFEVQMSPGGLKKWAESPEAKGIRAGFEAELIFRDTQNDNDDDGDYEPDMDYDERVNSVDQIIDFFNSGDGYVTDRQRNRIYDRFNDIIMEYVDNYVDYNFDYSDFKDEMSDSWDQEKEGFRRDAREELGDDADEDDIEERAKELWDDFLREKYDNGFDDPDYESILDQYRESVYNDLDVYDALRSSGLGDLSDWSSELGLDWPYMIGSSVSNGGERSWDDISEDLKKVIPSEFKVRVSSGYHSAKRDDDTWILEADGSLDPSSPQDAGIELISPPMPITQAFQTLKDVLKWASDKSGGNAYTNSSTGLHMGVSLPGDTDTKENIDYLKLLLFVGDPYVLDQFKKNMNDPDSPTRRTAYYASSSFDSFMKRAKDFDPAQIERYFSEMKKNFSDIAKELIETTFSPDKKYQSLHRKEKYIEFRGIGYDYLGVKSNNSEEYEKKLEEQLSNLQAIMLRYGRAMQLAGDPNAERNNYAKKLYKFLLTAEDKPDSQHAKIMGLFSQFASKDIDREQLKLQWADIVQTDGEIQQKLEKPFQLFYKDTELVTVRNLESAIDHIKTYLRLYTNHNVDDYRIVNLETNKEIDIQAKDLNKRKELAQRIKSQPQDKNGILVHAVDKNNQFIAQWVPNQLLQSIPNVISYVKKTDPRFNDIDPQDIEFQSNYSFEKFEKLQNDLKSKEVAESKKYEVKYSVNHLPKKATIIAENKSQVRQIIAEKFGTKSALITMIKEVK